MVHIRGKRRRTKNNALVVIQLMSMCFILAAILLFRKHAGTTASAFINAFRTQDVRVDKRVRSTPKNKLNTSIAPTPMTPKHDADADRARAPSS